MKAYILWPAAALFPLCAYYVGSWLNTTDITATQALALLAFSLAIITFALGVIFERSRK